mmetsp:Transcript_10802/g.35993  ORF Transcript_10802/g.35993 Transcript_10802/m.35993 type:complete len:164 (+) Transcript_10802:113-604(+)
MGGRGGRGGKRGGGGKSGGVTLNGSGGMPIPKFLRQYAELLPGAEQRRDGYAGDEDAEDDIVQKFLDDRKKEGGEPEPDLSLADALADGAAVEGQEAAAPPAPDLSSESAARRSAAAPRLESRPTFVSRKKKAPDESEARPPPKVHKKANVSLLSFADEDGED